MTYEIKQTDGKWTVNGKNINDCSQDEKKIFDSFLRIFKNKENN